MSLAGHAGKAFWFSKASGDFVTSSYYYEACPEWVTAWNARKPAQAWAGWAGELTHDGSRYLQQMLAATEELSSQLNTHGNS